MNTSSWGRTRTTGPPSSNNSNSTGLCVIGSACRFGSSRDVTAAADSRLIKMQIDGEEVSVDRYDVRLLLGDVAAFARQGCSEERRLAKLQESREIEKMRYEDLPRHAAFSDDLPPQQQQQQQLQWTPTLEQQQKEHQGTRAAGAAAAPRDSGQTLEGSGADFTAVPPPDALDQPEAYSASPAHLSASPPREGSTAAKAATAAEAETVTEEASVDSSEGNPCRPCLEAEIPQKQEQQQHLTQQSGQHDPCCFIPPFPDLPKDIVLPKSLREYLVVERTVHFVREEGDRMEFRLLLDEERRLPFLATSHHLYPFYSWMKQKGHSLVASAGELLPPRIRALLTFAYSFKSTSELQRQNQQHRQETEEAQTDVKNKQQQQEVVQQQHDPDGGLGLLLSYGSDEEDDEARGPREEKKKQEREHQPQQEHQHQQDKRQHQQYDKQRQQRTQEHEDQDADRLSSILLKKRPPPPPPLPIAAESAEGKSGEGEGEESASDREEASYNPKNLTTIWRSQRLTRFSLKKQKSAKTQKEERVEVEDSTEDVEMQLAALPKLPWALPSAKLGLSKVSCLAIQQIGHHLLCAGDLSRVQYAKTYEDDASPYPFLWTSSMDLRYFRYVLKCVETEMQKDGFVKPQPLPGPPHDMARSFLARLQLNHHLQQRKQQCMRLSESKLEDTSLDYLKTVETAAAAVAAAAASGSNRSNTSSAANPTAAPAESVDSPQITSAETFKIAEPLADVASTSYVAAAEGQLSPEAAAHLQMLLHQMAAASADNDITTYMACYSAYCYAVAALSPEAAASVAAATPPVVLTDTPAASDGARVGSPNDAAF